MRSITILIMVLICLFGLVWIGSASENIEKTDIGDEIDQEEAMEIYSPITIMTRIAVQGLPYIALLLVLIGALKLYQVN